MANVPTAILELLSKIQKGSYGEKISLRLNIALCNDYENGGLKSVDIFSKIVSLQFS